ncbi:Hypothetical protein CINCED_3A014664 [Cinara cedri]|uniref:Uncharacterized protein n=1 Tax=Cinara cedri TaxID=506608 RepID=A0A5E4M3R1_9HEMI|nr:Hypothetical protein CINCED_3A014664 [Cinara cedri]
MLASQETRRHQSKPRVRDNAPERGPTNQYPIHLPSAYGFSRRWVGIPLSNETHEPVRIQPQGTDYSTKPRPTTGPPFGAKSGSTPGLRRPPEIFLIILVVITTVDISEAENI